MMKKSWVWWTLAFVVGVAVGWFAYASTGKDEALPVRADVGTPATSSQAAVGSSSSAAALQEPQAVPVRVQQAQLRDVSLSLEAHGALAANREVRLSPKQYRLLQILVSNAGKVVTHRQLLTGIWGSAHPDDVQYLRVFVRKLRRRIEADPARPRYLMTELGVGYRLRTPEQLAAAT